jgi:hypothetical protein
MRKVLGVAGWFQCCLGLALTLGVGQFFSICGNYGLNCAACYTCHTREKFRRSAMSTDHAMTHLHALQDHENATSQLCSICNLKTLMCDFCLIQEI